ncbi:MAG TPA: tRNA (adenosine(37)-N6)-threonylcarbamoyltransferase complex ATPase subunit type 1 TsaE [Candidatus Acidoferrales bacterium]|nr:tRNA (adenosine(37)-N6)-threonylcarbamoyltransferase complex ATPase subunit type 1 TsaE [Candidatus Acidoferrales bacterium]
MRSFEWLSHSEEDTRAFGIRLGCCLKGGELIGLRGDLGVGKTVLVRGLAESLEIPATRVRSPTFTLINEYSGGRLPLYHIDLYRMEPTDVDRLAMRDYLYGDGVCVVEWVERLGEEAPALEIAMTFVGESRRRLVVTSTDAGYDVVFDCLQNG